MGIFSPFGWRRYFFSLLILVRVRNWSQVKLLVSNKWHTRKEGQAGNKKDNAAACLCFLNYLAFLRPAASRAVSILPWFVSRGRSYGLLWADSSIHNKCEEGRSNSGLFASNRPRIIRNRTANINIMVVSSQANNHRSCLLNCAKSNSTVKNRIFSLLWCSWSSLHFSTDPYIFSTTPAGANKANRRIGAKRGCPPFFRAGCLTLFIFLFLCSFYLLIRNSSFVFVLMRVQCRIGAQPRSSQVKSSN
jgi:hypothetical protein